MLRFINNLFLLIALICFCTKTKAQFCYPVSFGGVIPGITFEKQVLALFGKGFYDELAGHDGGWYYTNVDKSASLLIRIDVDKFVHSIVITSGLYFEDFDGDYNLYISNNFDVTDNGSFYIGLKASKEEILTKYGNPTISKDQNFWIYRSMIDNAQCHFANEVWIKFENDYVKSIIIAFDTDE